VNPVVPWLDWCGSVVFAAVCAALVPAGPRRKARSAVAAGIGACVGAFTGFGVRGMLMACSSDLGCVAGFLALENASGRPVWMEPGASFDAIIALLVSVATVYALVWAYRVRDVP